MAKIEIKGLVASINHIEAVRILLERLQNESTLALLRHRTLLSEMVLSCSFLADNIRMIDRDLTKS